MDRRADSPFITPNTAGGIDDSVLMETRPLATAALWTRKCVRLWASDISLWTRYSLRDPASGGRPAAPYAAAAAARRVVSYAAL